MSAKTVTIHLLPPETGLSAGSQTAVVVDVLRASTTIISALEAGASSIFPCLSVENAMAQHDCLRGGERGGVKLEGFDFGNSPTEYTADQVSGRTVAFTTTNGTRALLMSKKAGRVFVGAFANLSAIAEACIVADEVVEIVCAGTDGAISGEDVLFAGLLANRLAESAGFERGDDATQIAMDFSATNAENPSRLLEAVRQSQGGRNLISLGYDADIQFAANIDRFSLVPIFDADTRQITRA